MKMLEAHWCCELDKTSGKGRYQTHQTKVPPLDHIRHDLMTSGGPPEKLARSQSDWGHMGISMRPYP